MQTFLKIIVATLRHFKLLLYICVTINRGCNPTKLKKMSIERILTAKGYDNEQIQQIVYENPGFDAQVRCEFGIDQPIHLWEAYYIGDADAEEMNEIAINKGFDNYIELLAAMDGRLNQLAEEYHANGVELFIAQDYDENYHYSTISFIDLNDNCTAALMPGGWEKITISEKDFENIGEGGCWLEKNEDGSFSVQC